MHGKEFPIEFGEIGIYGNREITLWVAGAASNEIAAQMTAAMQAKIAQGNSPFTGRSFVAIICAWLWVTSAQGVEAPANFVFAYGAIGGNAVPLWIAKEQGIFRKYS